MSDIPAEFPRERSSSRAPDRERSRDVLTVFSTPEKIMPMDLHRRLLEAYAPPSVVVADDHTVIHVSESAGRYLTIKGGELSHDVLALVRPELRFDLRAALYQARNGRSGIRVMNIPVALEGGEHTVDISVRPVLSHDDPPRGLFLVLFDESPRLVEAPQRSGTLTNSEEPIARQLETDLTRVREQLRQAVEQHATKVEEARAANERLQAMYQKLRSTTEELATNKEELQSVNEELTAVNQELETKLDELARISSDLQSVTNAAELHQAHAALEARVRERTGQLQKEAQEHQRAKEAAVGLLRRLVRAQEDERRRIARDLHDHLGQQLTVLRLTLERHQASEQDPRRRSALDQALAVVGQVSTDLNLLAWELRPAVLDELGLAAALPRIAAEWSARVGLLAEVRVQGFVSGMLSADAELAFYRIVQEALNNVTRHAHATRVDVLLAVTDGLANLVIEDDGIGYDPQSEPAHPAAFGLSGIRERAALVGASVEVESSPGRGTSLFVRCPIGDKVTSSAPALPSEKGSWQ